LRVEAPRGNLRLFQIGQIEHHANPPESFVASWPGDVRLISATIESETGMPALKLDWFVGGSIDPRVTVFVHVQDANGQVVAQADGDLVGGYVPLGLWQPNDRVQELRTLSVNDLLAGEYTVAIGLYDRLSQQRLTPTRSLTPVSNGALSVATFNQP
jgi:hypothetical protein